MQITRARIVLMMSAAAVAVCGACNSDPAPSKVVAAVPAAVAPVHAQEADQGYSTTAPIFTENEVEVVSQREGVVLSVSAELGQRVHKGQLLAVLDDRQLAADYQSAVSKSKSLAADSKNWEAELKVAEVDEARAKSMYQAQLLTREQLDHAHYKMVASQYELERQKQDQITAERTAEGLSVELQKAKIVAPFDGTIARRYVRGGQHVVAADRLFWLVGDTPLRVRFMVPEARMASVKAGGKVQLASIYAPEQKFDGKIVAVSPAVDPGTASVEVIAELAAKNSSLKSGMTAQVTLPKN
jgi:membrane fusion protein, multidrug efflux system